jgi:hypothetical protein
MQMQVVGWQNVFTFCIFPNGFFLNTNIKNYKLTMTKMVVGNALNVFAAIFRFNLSNSSWLKSNDGRPGSEFVQRILGRGNANWPGHKAIIVCTKTWGSPSGINVK